MKMSKILLVGTYQGYNLESYVKLELEKLGHSVAFFQYHKLMGRFPSLVRMPITRSYFVRTLAQPLLLGKINNKIKAEVIKENPDFMITVKGEIMLPSTLDWIKKETSTKTALWYPDDPCYFNAFNKHLAPHYDHVFTASQLAIPRYKKIGVKSAYFLPLACNPSIHKKISLSEEDKKQYGHDVSFVGVCYPRRLRIMRRLKKFDVGVYGPYWKKISRRSNFHNGVWGPEQTKVFSASKIVLDIYDPTIRTEEVTCRTFEATGCGSFTLTERGHALDELYAIGKEVVCYSDEKELEELITYYLDADQERAEIADNGQKRAYSEHTYEMRVKFILDKMSS
jgi:spore maturation protein CgeB